MSIINTLSRDQFFGEFASPFETQGSGVLTPAQQKALALANLGLTALAAEINVLSGVTAGTVSASKALVVDANSRLTAMGGITFKDAENISFNTSTGTKIGTATGQKFGFWNATPVIQQASAAQAAVTPSTDFTGADTVDKAVVLAAVQAVETLVNRLRLDLVTTGIIKGAA
jgi:hypothetical protein